MGKLRKKEVKKAVNVIKGSGTTGWEKQVEFLKGKGLRDEELREAYIQVAGHVPWENQKAVADTSTMNQHNKQNSAARPSPDDIAEALR
jgi:hypothetical protein